MVNVDAWHVDYHYNPFCVMKNNLPQSLAIKFFMGETRFNNFVYHGVIVSLL
jgi:hypothetical protein